MNADPLGGETLDGLHDVDRIAAEPIQLRHHQHITGFEPINQPREPMTYFD